MQNNGWNILWIFVNLKRRPLFRRWWLVVICHLIKCLRSIALQLCFSLNWDLLQQFSLTDGSSISLWGPLFVAVWIYNCIYHHQHFHRHHRHHHPHHRHHHDRQDEDWSRGRLWLYALLPSRFLSPPSSFLFFFFPLHFFSNFFSSIFLAQLLFLSFILSSS